MTLYKTTLTLFIMAFLLAIVLPSCSPPEQPVSRQEALDLAKKIEQSVTTHNEAFLNDIFSTKQFTQRVLNEAHQRFNLTLAREAKAAITETRWGHNVITALHDGGRYSLVHQYEKAGHQHLLFRLFEASSAINYHDFELVKIDNTVKAIDVYVYMSGQDLSKTIAQSLVLMTDQLSEMTPDDQQKIVRLRKINELIEAGTPGDAAGYFDQLPDTLKRDKLFQLMHLRIAQSIGDTAYLDALNQYKADFPHDPSLGLLMLDAYVMEKDYPAALGAVNQLDTSLHTDPFLDFYRGLVYKLMDDTTRSRACFDNLQHNIPDVGKTYPSIRPFLKN